MLTVKLRNTGWTVEGHAAYAEHGQDIVCSAVSVLSQVIADGIQQYVYNVSIQKMTGYMDVEIGSHTLESKILYDTFVRGISALEREYHEYVKIIWY
jgi:uncharacterized protein YsxB (DUF464 family)